MREAAASADLVVGTVVPHGTRDTPPEEVWTPGREALLLREFDALSTARSFLWRDIHPARDQWNWEAADRVVAFAEEHGFELTGTHLFWDPPGARSVLPDWVRDIDDPDELRAVMREHVATMHQRYAGKVDRWNVVNEPGALAGGLEESNHFFQVLGPGWVKEAFEIAGDEWPDAQLALNETGAEYLPGRASTLVDLATELRRAGVRVDRVGIQGHLMFGEPNVELLTSTMQALADQGVTVDLTEVDVPRYGLNTAAPPLSEARQDELAALMVRICLDQPACRSVTFWGTDDGDTWLDNFIGPDTRPLLFDAQLRRKSMYDAVVAELRKGR